MNKILCIFFVLNTSFLFAQTKVYKFDMMFGDRFQRNIPLEKSPVFVGIGKDINLNKVFLLSYIKSESNFKDWFTFGIGARVSYTNNYYIQNLYPFVDLYIPFQNKKHKKEQEIGPISSTFGLGYVTKNKDKISVGLGFSEDWKPFFDIDYRMNINVKLKKKQKKYICPSL